MILTCDIDTVKWGASSRRSFYPNSALGSIETTNIEIMHSTYSIVYIRGDSMILTFHLPLLASGQGVCYIAGVLLGVLRIIRKKRVLVRRN